MEPRSQLSLLLRPAAAFESRLQEESVLCFETLSQPVIGIRDEIKYLVPASGVETKEEPVTATLPEPKEIIRFAVPAMLSTSVALIE